MKKILTIVFMMAIVSGNLSAFWTPFSPTFCEGRWSITERGGVEPLFYPYRQSNEVKNIVSICESFVDVNFQGAVINSFTLQDTLLIQKERKRAASFCDQFKTPWTAGLEIAYALTCDSEIFIDGDYMRADGRTDCYKVNFPSLPGVLTPPTPPAVLKPSESIKIHEEYSDLKGWGGHIGCRHYFPSWCLGGAFFVGGKVGVRHWDSVSAEVTVKDAINGEVEVGKFTYYPSNTVVSGGFQFGFNWCLSSCVSFVIMGEALGTGSFKFGKDVTVNRGEIARFEPDPEGEVEISEQREIRAVNTILEIPVRRIGTIMRFPVTIGLMISF